MLFHHCVISLNDYKSILEAFSKDSTTDRPKPDLFTLITPESSISWSGQLWKEHRRFSLRALRTIGVGKPSMEKLVADEISHLVKKIKESDSGQTPLRQLLGPSASNIVSAVMLGKRYDYEDPIRKMLNEVSGISGDFEGTPLLFTGYIVNFAKFIAYLIRLPTLPNTILRGIKETGFKLDQYLQQEVEEHLEKFDSTNIRDYCDAYLDEMKSRKSGEESNSTLSVPQMKRAAEGMFAAGSATVKDAVEWTLVYMAIHEDIQRKVQKEVDEIIGQDRRPSYADRALMPYTLAVINESLRYASMIPINLPHM